MLTGIESEGEQITRVTTQDGKVFRGERYVCNMDPQRASHVIGRDKFPAKYRERLDYSYSPSGVIVYLGLEGIDLREHGFDVVDHRVTANRFRRCSAR